MLKHIYLSVVYILDSEWSDEYVLCTFIGLSTVYLKKINLCLSSFLVFDLLNLYEIGYSRVNNDLSSNGFSFFYSMSINHIKTGNFYQICLYWHFIYT